jgi:preprotein translocase subunit Sss1
MKGRRMSGKYEQEEGIKEILERAEQIYRSQRKPTVEDISTKTVLTT